MVKKIILILLVIIIGFSFGVMKSYYDIEVNELERDLREFEKKLEVAQNQAEVNYMFGEATAYHPPSGGINSDENPEVTSIGEKAKAGVIAVDPDRIPYGSEVMIITDNTVIRGQALDTGKDMRENDQVDILMDCPEQAKKWGRKEAHIIWWRD